MRRHAKAPSAGSTSSTTKAARRKLLALAVLTLLASLVLGVSLAGAIAPTVSIDSSPSPSYTTAEVSGTVDPEDNATDVYAEYATPPGSGNWQFTLLQAVPAQADPGTEGAVPVAGEISNLQPGTEYEVRLTASNSAHGEITSASPNPTFTTLAVPPPAVTLDPVTTITGESAHFEGTIEPGTPPGDDPAFEVKWNFECTPACPGIEGIKTIPANNAEASVEVEVEATSLDPNTDYEVRLIASNAGGENVESDTFKTLTLGAEAISLPAAGITETSAVIGGWVDPNGSPTTYYLQYASEADFSDANSIPASEDASAGSGAKAIPVSTLVTGLAPESVYHFRVIANSGAGDDTSDPQSFSTLAPEAPQGCPNAQFRVGPSAALPGCRAFEKVSPGDKNGGEADPGAILDASHTGVRATAAFHPDDASFDGTARYLATRIASGWQTRSTSVATHSRIADVNTGNTQDIINQETCSLSCLSLDPADTDNSRDVYRRDSDGIHLVSQGSEGGNSGEEARYSGQSTDGSHILFETTEHLEATDAGRTTGRQLYEWVNGQTRVVGLDSSGDLISDGGAVLGDGLGFQPGPAGASNAISDDGRTIFFESPDPGYDPDTGFLPVAEPDLYARIDGSETVHISASRCDPACSEPSGPAIFQGASDDGDVVYFTTAAQLLNADSDSTLDLYRYKLSNEELILVSQDCTGGDGSIVDCSWPISDFAENKGASGIGGVIGVSESGDRIYFVSPMDSITPNAVAPASIWIYDRDSNAATFVAPTEGSGSLVDSRLNKGSFEARITPDGESLVFESQYRLTSFNNQCSLFNEKCKEIYRYRASSQEIDCVSCNIQGATPQGNADYALDLALAAGSLSELHSARVPNTLIDESGNTIVFQTDDALLPTDTNNRSDVYEWQRGHLHLISTGRSPVDSTLGGVSEDGRSIFFSTEEPLVPADLDVIGDLYAARINGGLFVDHAVAAQDCSGSSCRGSATTSPPIAASGTNTFHSEGNPRPRKTARCTGGKVRRKGECRKRKSRHRGTGKKKKGPQASRINFRTSSNQAAR